MPDFVRVKSEETGNEFLVDRVNLNDTLKVVENDAVESKPTKPAAGGKKED